MQGTQGTSRKHSNMLILNDSYSSVNVHFMKIRTFVRIFIQKFNYRKMPLFCRGNGLPWLMWTGLIQSIQDWVEQRAE